MKDRRVKSHFSKKRKHTQIKHKIFEVAFSSSLSIANMQLPKMNWTNPLFLYLDLFAGAGRFESGEKGSILIAIDLIKKHIFAERGERVKNNFEEFYVVAIEKDINAYETLNENIDKLKLPKQIKVGTGSGEWENYDTDLKYFLEETHWGFIFADPFSTELNIKKFKEVLKDAVKMQDILIFFNLQTLRRQKGRKLDSDIERLKNAIGLTWEEIEEEKDLSDAVRKGIESNFSDIKNFAVGIAYPVAKEDKLTTMDYFYMVLLSNSYGVIDSFLEGYADILDEYYFSKSKGVEQRRLFESVYFKPENDQTLLEFWQHEINKFLSWKEIVSTGIRKVPTIKNIVKELNSLKNKGDIEILCPQEYLYKRKGDYGKKGDLNPNKLSSKDDLNAIQIKVIR